MYPASTSTALTLTGLLLWASAAQATDFALTPVQLPGGVSIFGTVSTDGSLGPLSPANLTGWRITVRSKEVHLYTPADPGGAQVSAVTVSADGRRMKVKTSPDGARDGGLLAFGSFGPGPEHGVQVANFSGPWAAGGVAFWLDGPGFEWQWLQAPNGSQRVVAKAAAGSHRFDLVPVSFPSGTLMSGRITTDGSTGKLSAAQILDWKISAVTLTDAVYYKDATGANSSVLPSSVAFSTDGVQLFVARPDGYLGFGIPPAPPRRGAGAVLADFSATAPDGGQVGWFDPFGLQFKDLNFGGALYPVANAIP